MRARRAKAVRRSRNAVLAALILATPALMGGCPEFQNNVVNLANEATQTVVLSNGDPQVALESATRGMLSALIDLAFDQFRNDSIR